MTYDPTLATSKDVVRFLVNDKVAPYVLQDTEINFILVSKPNHYSAAAEAAESIAATYAGRADKTVGPLHISYSRHADRYVELAASLRRRAGSGAKVVNTQNPLRDRSFKIGQSDYPDTYGPNDTKNGANTSLLLGNSDYGVGHQT